MNPKITKLIKSLESLQKTIDDAVINVDGFAAHGWNYVHINQDQISVSVHNAVEKLKSYKDAKITNNFDAFIDIHIKSIEELNETAKSYFTSHASHLIHFVPVMLLTLQTVCNDIDFELFSYENLQDKKLLPRGLAIRLRGLSSRLDSLEDSSSDLQSKISIINDAHEAAESLPTDLAGLKEARKELNDLIQSARKELDLTKNELKQIKDQSLEFRNEAKSSCESVKLLKNEVESSAAQASDLVSQCDDALQITTTQGLAAGFDQKAVELKKSMWIWIAGLLIALGAGAWIGAERVDAFTQVIDKDLTAGQAILHTIMSIFSIGGPLWLAWISTQQINQRFKLSEDYFYKATVAKSFTGFKKFAERFDPETEARLFNSALDRIDEMPLRLINNKDYNSPWHEFVDSESFRNASSMFPSLAQEAGRFANKLDLKIRNKPAVMKTQPDKKDNFDEKAPEPDAE